MKINLTKLSKIAVVLSLTLSLTVTPLNCYAAVGNDTAGSGMDTTDPNLGGAQKGNGIGSATGDSNLDAGNEKCPNSHMLEKILQTTCWTCIFPMVIMGIQFNFGGTRDDVEMPEERAKKVTCRCEDRAGLPYYGTLYSLWQPAKLVEFVREPGCSPVLFGTEIGAMSKMGTANSEQNGKDDTPHEIFMNYHYFVYPLLAMLEMQNNTPSCIKDGYIDMDLLFASEIDPTWNDDCVAFFTNMEVVLFNNPVGVIACLPDAISSTVLRKPISSLFWCAGSWGLIYPFSGFVNTTRGALEGSSLMTVKMLAALHRRGFLKLTYGDDAMCKPLIHPFIPKSQYKLTMIYPVPENKSAHALGEAVIRWGLARKVPVSGEDFVYLLWTWNDCCLSVAGAN